jgi:hypothetical protein
MYTFYINGLHKTVEANSDEEVMKEARIREDDPYYLVEIESFDDTCFLSAVADEVLCGHKMRARDKKNVIYAVTDIQERERKKRTYEL